MDRNNRMGRWFPEPRGERKMLPIAKLHVEPSQHSSSPHPAARYLSIPGVPHTAEPNPEPQQQRTKAGRKQHALTQPSNRIKAHIFCKPLEPLQHPAHTRSGTDESTAHPVTIRVEFPSYPQEVSSSQAVPLSSLPVPPCGAGSAQPSPSH